MPQDNRKNEAQVKKRGEDHITIGGAMELLFEGVGWYQGELKGESRHGIGRLRYKNGNIYEGEFENGIRHGRGKMTYPNGNVFYEGEFSGDEYHGRGKLISANGEVHEGEFKDDEAIPNTITTTRPSTEEEVKKSRSH